MWVFARVISYLKTALLAMAGATLLFVLYGGIRTSASAASILWFSTFVIAISFVAGCYWFRRKSFVRYELKRLAELVAELEQAQTKSLERQTVIKNLQELIRDFERIERVDSKRFLNRPHEKVGAGV